MYYVKIHIDNTFFGSQYVMYFCLLGSVLPECDQYLAIYTF